MAVNLRASFLACKYALPQMNDGGSIVMTSSVVGVSSDPGICAYAASKHAPGESHTLVAYEHAQPMKVFFIVTGPLIWLDEQGEPAGHFDVHAYIALCRAHYEKNGIGAAYIDRLFR